jgi:hypothetical protein
MDANGKDVNPESARFDNAGGYKMLLRTKKEEAYSLLVVVDNYVLLQLSLEKF